MKVQESKRAHDTARERRKDGGAEEAKDATQLVQLERGAMEALDEPCGNDGARSVGHRKKRGAGKVAVAEQVGR